MGKGWGGEGESKMNTFLDMMEMWRSPPLLVVEKTSGEEEVMRKSLSCVNLCQRIS